MKKNCELCGVALSAPTWNENDFRDAEGYLHGYGRCKPRRFHELVLINGAPEIGDGTKIGIFSEVYDKGGIVKIGKNVDVASFVAINCADSSRKTLGLSEEVELLPIEIGDNVFIGTHSAILGGCKIGHHTVIGAGVVLRKRMEIPPYSLVSKHLIPNEIMDYGKMKTWLLDNGFVVIPGFYREMCDGKT